MKKLTLKQLFELILAILLTIISIQSIRFVKYGVIKKNNQPKPTKTDSLTYQIKVRDSIIYDLYQENKRLKNNLKY